MTRKPILRDKDSGMVNIGGVMVNDPTITKDNEFDPEKHVDADKGEEFVDPTAETSAFEGVDDFLKEESEKEETKEEDTEKSES